MVNKKGQFYLLAAIVIIAIIMGFSAISNYVGQETTTRIYDLGEELEIESANVIDFGTYDAQVDTSELLENFSDLYADYIGEDKGLVVVIVTPDEIISIPYEQKRIGQIENEGSIHTTINREKGQKRYEDKKTRDGKEYVEVEFGEEEFEFELPEGHNYYFVIEQEIEEEKFVYKKEQ